MSQHRPSRHPRHPRILGWLATALVLAAVTAAGCATPTQSTLPVDTTPALQGARFFAPDDLAELVDEGRLPSPVHLADGVDGMVPVVAAYVDDTTGAVRQLSVTYVPDGKNPETIANQALIEDGGITLSAAAAAPIGSPGDEVRVQVIGADGPRTGWVHEALPGMQVLRWWDDGVETTIVSDLRDPEALLRNATLGLPDDPWEPTGGFEPLPDQPEPPAVEDLFSEVQSGQLEDFPELYYLTDATFWPGADTDELAAALFTAEDERTQIQVAAARYATTEQARASVERYLTVPELCVPVDPAEVLDDPDAFPTPLHACVVPPPEPGGDQNVPVTEIVFPLGRSVAIARGYWIDETADNGLLEAVAAGRVARWTDAS